jgi:mRNA-degrading endonuclease RelE of RelBE toxin-antitoxin system
MIVKFLPEAEQELDYAIKYYNKQQINLGYQFLDEIILGINIIQSTPDAWQKLSKNTRRYQIRRFPYGIIYYKDTNNLIIVAVANLKQKPNYWINRI